MAISAYDPQRFDSELPANVRGGIARAKLARDNLGRFLPSSGTLPHDSNHGRVGGIKRAKFAKRSSDGKFSK